MLGFGHFGSVAAFIRLTRPKRVRLRYGSRAHLARLRAHHYWIRTLAWLPVKRATTGLGHFTQPDQPGLAWRTKIGHSGIPNLAPISVHGFRYRITANPVSDWLAPVKNTQSTTSARACRRRRLEMTLSDFR